MAQFIKHFVQDLDQDLRVRQCGTIVFNADNLSNVITVDLYHGTTPAELSGSVAGAVICSDGTTVPVTGGTISGNTVSITLTGDCFAIPGPIGVGIQIVNGTEKTTVLKAVYNVELFTTDTVIDPGSRITVTVGDLVDDIETAVATIPAEYSDFMASVAPLYNTISFPLPAGSLCWYDGTLYQATQDIPATETWTAEHWETAVVSTAILDRLAKDEWNTTKALNEIGTVTTAQEAMELPTISSGAYKGEIGDKIAIGGTSRSDFKNFSLIPVPGTTYTIRIRKTTSTTYTHYIYATDGHDIILRTWGAPSSSAGESETILVDPPTGTAKLYVWSYGTVDSIFTLAKNSPVTLQNQINTLSAAQAQDAANIATLTTAQAQDAANIATLTTAQAQDAADIATLTAAQAQDAANIATLTTAQAQDAENIRGNAYDISELRYVDGDVITETITLDLTNTEQGSGFSKGAWTGNVGDVIRAAGTNDSFRHCYINHIPGAHYTVKTRITTTTTYPSYVFAVDENDVILQKWGDHSTSGQVVTYYDIDPPEFTAKICVWGFTAEAYETTYIGITAYGVTIDFQTQINQIVTPLIHPAMESYNAKAAGIAAHSASSVALNFAFITDTHVDGTATGQTGMANLELFSRIANSGLPVFAVHCGDISTHYDSPETTKAEYIKWLSAAMEKMGGINVPLYISKGNHDCNGDGTETLTAYEWQALTQNKAGVPVENNSVASGYYYVDYALQKVRVIVLCCMGIADGSSGYGTTGVPSGKKAEGLWLAQDALALPAAGWSVVILVHDLTTTASAVETSNIWAILTAFKTGTSTRVYSTNIDYTAQGPGNIVAIIKGHEHGDLYETVRDINVVTVTRGFGKDDPEHGVTQIGTMDQFAVSVFSVDTANRTLYETRIGRGSDRSFAY